ncbi:hypothetical protein C8R45DRAFT_1114176 [Mycena sanguinolenta]|nr:hypothetical protein C8R45DRAFT_1114176 [Mycena sanguinolenta]
MHHAHRQDMLTSPTPTPQMSSDPATASSACPKKKKKTKQPKFADPEVATDYVEYGRVISRFLGIFTNMRDVIEYGTTAGCAMSDDEVEVDEKLAEGYQILWRKFPGFCGYLLKVTNKPAERCTTESQLTFEIGCVRSDDTATLKSCIHLYVLQDQNTPLDPPFTNLKLKMYRGRAHPIFAKLLMPIDWPADDVTTQGILEGGRKVEGMQLPRFIFPVEQDFPVGVPMEDPMWLAVLENGLRGEVLLWSAKCLFMGPESSFKCNGYHKGRTGKASIIGMLSFTPRVICWVVTQVHFALSSKQDWHKIDGDFNYEDFYWTIYSLFDDDEFAQRILGLWNNNPSRGVVTPQPTGPSHLEQLKVLRAARKLAATAATTTVNAATSASTTPVPAAAVITTRPASPPMEDLD